MTVRPVLPFISSGHLAPRCLSPQPQTRFPPLTSTRLRLQLRGLVPHCSSLPRSSSSVRSPPPSLLLCSAAPSVPRPSSFPLLPPLRHICSIRLDAKIRRVDSLHVNCEFVLSLTCVTTRELKLPFIVLRCVFSCIYYYRVRAII